MKPTIHMIAPLSAPELRTRLAKQVGVLTQAGYPVSFSGWERVRGEADGAAAFPLSGRRIILRGGGYGKKTTLLFYPLWSLRVFFHVLFMPRDARLLCLGFETAAPALLASLFSRRRIVFDDADRFSMTFPLPGVLGRIVARLEQWASQKAFRHIVPGLERYSWRNAGMVTLRNTPALEDFRGAARLDIAQELGIPAADGAFTIYANGWIGETRGAPILLALMKVLQRRGVPVRLLVMGRGDGNAFAELIAREDVLAFADKPQQIALAAYTISDLLFTYYDPRIPINRLAASNKWGDAIYMGRTFVVNSEVETAGHFVDRGAAFAVPYRDVEALADLVERLAGDRAQLDRAINALRDFREDYIPFDQRFEDIAATLAAPR